VRSSSPFPGPHSHRQKQHHVPLALPGPHLAAAAGVSAGIFLFYEASAVLFGIREGRCSNQIAGVGAPNSRGCYVHRRRVSIPAICSLITPYASICLRQSRAVSIQVSALMCSEEGSTSFLRICANKIVAKYPRKHFKEDFIQAYFAGFAHKLRTSLAPRTAP
jgi:hypothetical protein